LSGPSIYYYCMFPQVWCWLISHSDALSIFGDFASFIGLGISLWVLIRVDSIKTELLSKLRLPEAIRDLEKTTDELREALKCWPSTETEANTLIHRVDGILVSFIPKLSGLAKKKLAKSHDLIKKRKSLWRRVSRPSEEDRKDGMWAMHDSLIEGIEILRQCNKDNKKRV
jgi:hypothetical protein